MLVEQPGDGGRRDQPGRRVRLGLPPRRPRVLQRRGARTAPHLGRARGDQPVAGRRHHLVVHGVELVQHPEGHLDRLRLAGRPRRSGSRALPKPPSGFGRRPGRQHQARSPPRNWWANRYRSISRPVRQTNPAAASSRSVTPLRLLVVAGSRPWSPAGRGAVLEETVVLQPAGRRPATRAAGERPARRVHSAVMGPGRRSRRGPRPRPGSAAHPGRPGAGRAGAGTAAPGPGSWGRSRRRPGTGGAAAARPGRRSARGHHPAGGGRVPLQPGDGRRDQGVRRDGVAEAAGQPGRHGLHRAAGEAASPTRSASSRPARPHRASGVTRMSRSSRPGGPSRAGAAPGWKRTPRRPRRTAGGPATAGCRGRPG